MLIECLDGDAVAVKAEPHDRLYCGKRDERVLAELVARIYIGEIYLDGGDSDRFECIKYSYARVSISSRIYNDTVKNSVAF
jgi:hypothetical protein